MADSDNTLKILIQLGVTGAEDAKAAKELLGETAEAAQGMNQSLPSPPQTEKPS